MSVVKTAVKRPVTVSMVTLGILIFGFISLTKLPVNLLPDLSYPTLTLETKYTGAAPEEVEYLVTRPIEEAVAVVPQLKRMTSSSKPELSQVTLEFEWGKQMDFAILDVSKKVDLLRLPEGVEKPRILRYDPNQDPILKVNVTSDKMDLTELRFFCEEEVKKRLDGVPGLASIKVVGGLEEIVEVMLNESKMRQFGLSIEQVSTRLREENVNRAGGSLYENEARYLVRTMNEFASIEEVGLTIVANIEGRKIYLKEVADINYGAKDQEHISRVNGTEGVELAFYKEGDANTVKVNQELKKAVAKTADLFKDDIDCETTFEGATFIERSIEEVKSNAVFGGFIAVLVLLFFLRDVKGTLVIAISIPVSVFIAFFMMLQFGVSLNIMSLGGLALGIGMLVDNSIVVLESIFVKKESGIDAQTAAQEGTSLVSGAVVASTLTTIVVFLPIVFVEGVGGQLFRDLGMTVSFSLVASLVVALTLIPTLFAFLSRFWKGRSIRITQQGEVRGFYPKLLGFALKHRFLALALIVLIAFQGALVYKRMGVNLIPEMTQGDFYLLLELDQGAPIAKTDETASWIESQIKDLPGMKLVFSSVGEFSQGLEQRIGENLAQINFKAEPEQADTLLDSVREILNTRDGISYQLGQPSFFSFRTPIEIEIFGEQREDLKGASNHIIQQMEEMGIFKDIQTTIADGNPEIQVEFKRETMSQMGLSIGTIAQILRDKVQGATPTRLVRSGRDVDMVVRLREDDRTEIEQIGKLAVGYQDGRPIYLNSVANITTDVGPSQIKRAEQKRCAIITAGLKDTDLASAKALLDPMLVETKGRFANIDDIATSGQTEEMEASNRSVYFMVLLAVFLVYLVMASQFESLLYPFLILFTVPLGLVGGLNALYFANLELSIVAMIGLVMLAGIVVNNAIVLVDYVNNLRREEGMSLYDALITGGSRRIRPILMTTATTVLGLIPMAMGIGEGAEMRMPLAVGVIGGLVFSTLITLILIPVLYAIVTPGLEIPGPKRLVEEQEALS